MSTVANLPVLLQSQPLLAQLANAEQNAPHTQAMFAQELAKQTQKKMMEQVQKVDKQDKSKAVDEKPGRNKPRHQASDRQKDQAEEETSSQAKSPWSGNIINLKI